MVPLWMQIENPHRVRDAMDRYADSLRMRATRSIGIRQDYDVAILEERRQSGIPFGSGALGSRRSHEPDLGKSICVLLALAEVHRGLGWSADKFWQSIRNLRAIRLALRPAVAVPVK